MRFVRNRFRDPAPFPPPSTAAREFHRTLAGYAPAPLVDCQPLADSDKHRHECRRGTPRAGATSCL